MYQALYRKWRPLTFDDVVGQGHITQTLKHQVETDRLSHAYLFTGTRGTGKTTCAKILARAVNCEHPVNGNPCNQCAACRSILDESNTDVQELDAASNNGVDQVRMMREEAVFSPVSVRKRIYIIDEAHMLTVPAFNALLKILEEPPEHLMFVLATTELHKVPATILSRCQRFSFKRILPEEIVARLNYVAEQEHMELTMDASTMLARLADGGMRDALSLLDQCAVGGGTIDRTRVLDTLGMAGNTKTAHIFNAIRKGDAASALSVFGELYQAGKDVSAVLSELIDLSRDLLIRRTARNSGAGLMIGGYDEATLATLEKNMPAERLISILSLLEQAAQDAKRSGNSRTVAEICLIRLCDPSLDGSNLGLAARVAKLEAAVAQGVPAGAVVPETAPAPTAQSAPPASQAQPESAPRVRADQAGVSSATPAPSPGAGAPGWDRLLPALQGKVPPRVYPFVKMAAADWREDTLVLQFRDDFSCDQVNDPEVLRIIAQTASALAGRGVQVRVERPGGRASINDLKEFLRKQS